MQDEVRKQLYEASEKFQSQLEDTIDSYAKFQRGIIQNDVKLNNDDKLMWIPKSQIENPKWKEAKLISIPDWLYERKLDELFFGG